MEAMVISAAIYLLYPSLQGGLRGQVASVVGLQPEHSQFRCINIPAYIYLYI
jgi:hypothetical protein